MHVSVLRALREWVETIGGAAGKAVADLGAYNINGSVKDVLPHALGFDLVAGPGVDVVIELGSIPLEYRNRYDLVTSISSFQFCPFPQAYKNEIIRLLKPHGLLFLTMCAPSCRSNHTTIPPFKDCLRMTVEDLAKLMSPEIFMQNGYIRQAENHADIIFVGERM